MAYSFCIQNTYHEVVVALCNDATTIAQRSIPNNQTNARLVLILEQLLQEYNLSLNECSYIAVTQGPAPFTSLRSVLATVNGIHMSTHTPLIGIDSLLLLSSLSANEPFQYTLTLLDAFNKDLYYALRNNNTLITLTGYASIIKITDIVNQHVGAHQILLLGQGTFLHQDYLKDCPLSVVLSEQLLSVPSFENVVKKGYEQWINGKIHVGPIMPLYLKKHQAEHL